MSTLAQIVSKATPNLLSFDATMLLFRLLASVSLITIHGMKKVLNFSEEVANIPDPFGMGGYTSAVIAIIANIVAPIFIILGLGTRLAAAMVLSVTLTGFFVVHAADPLPIRDTPGIYSLVFLLIFFMGAGKYSIDHKLFK